MDLIIPKVELLETGIVVQRVAKSAKSGITKPNVVPLEGDLFYGVIVLQELGQERGSPLSDVVSFQVQF